MTYMAVNAVERVLWYADKQTLPQEPPHQDHASKPALSWPQRGRIVFEDVVLSYRPGLPTVLKGMWVAMLRPRLNGK